MAQPRRDFPPGKGLYMGGRRDLSPTAGQTPPERRQGEALRRSVFSPRRLHRPRRDPAVRQGCCQGDNAFSESLSRRSLSRPSGASSLYTREPLAMQHRQLPTAEAAPRPGGQQALLTEASSRPGTPVLPPQRPFHRQSRQAASRVAGTSNRSRQPTGDSRPPSPGERSRKGNPLPGFRRKPERIRIIFPGDMCGGKNSSHGAKCGCKAAFGRPCSRTRAQCFAIVSAPEGR